MTRQISTSQARSTRLRASYYSYILTCLNHFRSLNAISMTMFAHDVSVSSRPDSVAALMHNMANGPSGKDTTLRRLMTVVMRSYPILLGLPNPMQRWAKMLRAELGKIAQEVWDSGERNNVVGGMDARALEVLSMHEICIEWFAY